MSYNNKTRVLFVQAYDHASPESFLSVPLGVHRVGAHCEAKVPGVHCDYYDPNLHHPSSTPKGEFPGLEKLKTFMHDGMDGKGPYDVFAISPLHFTWEYDLANMFNAEEIARSMGRLDQTLFISGGQQTSFIKGAEFLKDTWPAVDAIVAGEGEKPMEGILRQIKEHGAKKVKANQNYLEQVPGLYLPDRKWITAANIPMTPTEYVAATMRLDFGKWMRSEDYWAWIMNNYTEEQLADRDMQRKIRVAKPYTTNFCPMDCFFCSTTNFLRDAGMSNTIVEGAKGKKGFAKVVGIRGKILGDYTRKILDTNKRVLTVYFKDDLWFIRGSGGDMELPQDFMRDIRDAYPGKHMRKIRDGRDRGDRGLMNDLAELWRIKNDPEYVDREISYFGKARVDTFVNDKTQEVDWLLLAATKRAGFNAISFGVESFDQAELNHFNKKIEDNGPLTNTRALQACQEMGIDVIAYMILSCDISTPDSIMTSVDHASVLSTQGHVIKINPFLFSLPGTQLAEINEAKRSSTLTREFTIPGYPDFKVERIQKIFPENKTAQELMMQFDERLPAYKEMMKSRLGISHWISEIGTPTQFRLLLDIAKEMNLAPKNTNTGKEIDLDSRIVMLDEFIDEHKRDLPKFATYA
jgi:radical SAM superfamily enzyme YgiQ (UPF0313 family)